MFECINGDGELSKEELGAILDRLEILEKKVENYDKLASTRQLQIDNKIKTLSSKVENVAKSNAELVNVMGERVGILESILQKEEGECDDNDAQLDTVDEIEYEDEQSSDQTDTIFYN